MGEFHDAVSTLLESFARGISIIRTQRKRRKSGHIPIDQSSKNAETDLSRCLKKNRTEVKTAYGRDLDRSGPGFAAGDAEAHSSLSAILFRLNAGFVSVIERFTKGRSSSTDYKILVNLSNSSRLEAINTFQQLSYRLSRSSLALAPSGRRTDRHKKQTKTKKSSASAVPKHTRVKSAPELSQTALGPATPGGWVRPKAGRKLSADSSRSSGSSTPKAQRKPPSPRPLALPSPPPTPSTPSTHRRCSSPPPYQSQLPSPAPPPPQRLLPVRSPREHRKSIMSFASDSTKLGEIPERKWGRNADLDGGQFTITPYYPMEPYQEPEKPRSRLRRLFGKS